MLKSLAIQDFIIIKELTIDFTKDFTVLTGETGAGKSIIIDAIQLLLGGRSSGEYVRNESDRCLIQGIFKMNSNSDLLSILLDNDIEVEEDLIISRIITKDGSSKSRINGVLVPLSTLKEISKFLVDIHSQHKNNDLLSSKNHIKLLDRYAKLNDFLQNYKMKYKAYLSIKKTWDEAKNDVFNEQKLDIYEYQLKEINDVNILEHEEETLQDLKKQLSNHEKISDHLNTSSSLMDEVNSKLFDVSKRIQSISLFSKEYEELNERIHNIYYEVDDLSHTINDWCKQLDYSDYSLDEVESRLFLIQKIYRKYGGSYQSLMSFKNELLNEIERFNNREVYLEQLNNSLQKAYDECLLDALELSRLRKLNATLLEQAITNELKDLYMDKAKIEVSITNEMDDTFYILNENGIDSVEFLIATNVGDEVKSLHKIASGGELSRFMLALKIIFTQSIDQITIIFDEIDTGVSGNVGAAIGKKMKQLSETQQVISITHLPQVAAMASNHLYVTKQIIENSTYTNIQYLSKEERVVKLAELLSGDNITEAALLNAQELLN